MRQRCCIYRLHAMHREAPAPRTPSAEMKEKSTLPLALALHMPTVRWHTAAKCDGQLDKGIPIMSTFSMTVSEAGTARLREMMAQGKLPVAGTINGTNVSYPDAQDAATPAPASTPPTAPAPALPATITDLLKLHADATDAQDNGAAEKIQRQIMSLANESSISFSGNLINDQA